MTFTDRSHRSANGLALSAPPFPGVAFLGVDAIGQAQKQMCRPIRNELSLGFDLREEFVAKTNRLVIAPGAERPADSSLPPVPRQRVVNPPRPVVAP
jgi:hypothetical protein